MNAPASHASVAPGTLVAGRYLLGEPCDTTGRTTVYRARDIEKAGGDGADVIVSIGELPARGVAEAVRRAEQLKKRVGTRAAVDAPAILDAGVEGDRCFVVERWPGGALLRHLIRARRVRGTPFGAEEVLAVIAMTARALEALPNGVAHGDIRSARIVLREDGVRLIGAFIFPQLEVSVPRDEAMEHRDRRALGGIAYEMLTGESIAAGPRAEIEGSARVALELSRANEAESRSKMATLLESLNADVRASKTKASSPKLVVATFAKPAEDANADLVTSEHGERAPLGASPPGDTANPAADTAPLTPSFRFDEYVNDEGTRPGRPSSQRTTPTPDAPAAARTPSGPFSFELVTKVPTPVPPSTASARASAATEGSTPEIALSDADMQLEPPTPVHVPISSDLTNTQLTPISSAIAAFGPPVPETEAPTSIVRVASLPPPPRGRGILVAAFVLAVAIIVGGVAVNRMRAKRSEASPRMTTTLP